MDLSHLNDVPRTQLPGGRNNRVFRIDTSVGNDNGPFCLKVYFKNSTDLRDRLFHEYSFSRFAWDHGIKQLPEPIAADFESDSALYRYIAGRKILREELEPSYIQSALQFVLQINQHKTSPSARELPLASEACFSLAKHRICIDRRVNQLRDIGSSSQVQKEALAFVENKLVPNWEVLRASLDDEEEVPPCDRVLSPSDFGFHNALVDDHGSVHFLDFEYAGWDDPAKLVCDFFCQPEVPIDLKYFESFASKIVNGLSDIPWHSERIAKLFPAFQIKWCCILLNEFRKSDGERRNYSGNNVTEIKQIEQLRKANLLLTNLLNAQN